MQGACPLAKGSGDLPRIPRKHLFQPGNRNGQPHRVVQAAGIEAACTVGKRRGRFDGEAPIRPAVVGDPVVFDRPAVFTPARRSPQAGQAACAQQPLVAHGHDEVGLPAFDIRRHDAQALAEVEHERDLAFLERGTDAVKVEHGAVVPAHLGQGGDAKVWFFGDRGEHGLGPVLAGFARNAAQPRAGVGAALLPAQQVRGELAFEHQHGIAGSQRQAVGGGGQAEGRRGHQRNGMRFAGEKLRQQRAQFLSLLRWRRRHSLPGPRHGFEGGQARRMCGSKARTLRGAVQVQRITLHHERAGSGRQRHGGRIRQRRCGRCGLGHGATLRQRAAAVLRPPDGVNHASFTRRRYS